MVMVGGGCGSWMVMNGDGRRGEGGGGDGRRGAVTGHFPANF